MGFIQYFIVFLGGLFLAYLVHLLWQWKLNKILKYLRNFTLILSCYLLICFFHQLNIGRDIVTDCIQMSGEMDYLLGTDRIDFYCGGKSFSAEYADHFYSGTCSKKNGTYSFETDIDIFSPFREPFFPKLYFKESADGNFLLDQDSNKVYKIYYILGK